MEATRLPETKAEFAYAARVRDLEKAINRIWALSRGLEVHTATTIRTICKECLPQVGEWDKDGLDPRQNQA